MKSFKNHIEEAVLDEAIKAYVSSLAPKFGTKGSHDVIGKDGKVVKSFPHTDDGMKAAIKHLSKMKEEVEQLDELSPNLLHRYVKKAAGNLAGNAAVAATQASSSMKKSSPD